MPKDLNDLAKAIAKARNSASILGDSIDEWNRLALRYRHTKPGNIYLLIAEGVDCTNSRDGTPVTIYRPEDEHSRIYVRASDEFADRFEPLS